MPNSWSLENAGKLTLNKHLGTTFRRLLEYNLGKRVDDDELLKYDSLWNHTFTHTLTEIIIFHGYLDDDHDS